MEHVGVGGRLFVSSQVCLLAQMIGLRRRQEISGNHYYTAGVGVAMRVLLVRDVVLCISPLLSLFLFISLSSFDQQLRLRLLMGLVHASSLASTLPQTDRGLASPRRKVGLGL